MNPALPSPLPCYGPLTYEGNVSAALPLFDALDKWVKAQVRLLYASNLLRWLLAAGCWLLPAACC